MFGHKEIFRHGAPKYLLMMSAALSLPVFGEGGAKRRVGIIYIRQKCQSDCLKDAVHISINVGVGKSKHAIAAIVQHSIANAVLSPISIEAMLHAIDFDDQPSPPAFEIHNVMRNRRLAAKMKAKFA